MPLVPVTNFGISKNLYALDPAGFKIGYRSKGFNDLNFQLYVSGIWFRRRANGTITACCGMLTDSLRLPKHYRGNPELRDMIENFTGFTGSSEAVMSWDGQHMWYAREGVENHPLWQPRQQTLKDALTAYPAVPTGYQGWYRIEKSQAWLNLFGRR